MANQLSPVEVQAADGVLYIIVDPSIPLEDVREMLRMGRVEMMNTQSSVWSSCEEYKTKGGFFTY